MVLWASQRRRKGTTQVSTSFDWCFLSRKPTPKPPTENSSPLPQPIHFTVPDPSNNPRWSHQGDCARGESSALRTAVPESSKKHQWRPTPDRFRSRETHRENTPPGLASRLHDGTEGTQTVSRSGWNCPGFRFVRDKQSSFREACHPLPCDVFRVYLEPRHDLCFWGVVDGPK